MVPRDKCVPVRAIGRELFISRNATEHAKSGDENAATLRLTSAYLMLWPFRQQNDAEAQGSKEIMQKPWDCAASAVAEAAKPDR